MKAKKIWIAQHPEDPKAVDIQLEEPDYSGALLGDADEWVEYKEYILIEVES